MNERRPVAHPAPTVHKRRSLITPHSSPLKISIVHYHARPGGVTRVVERAVEALGAKTRCLFFTGEAARSTTPLQKKIRVVPNLGYSTNQKSRPLDLLKHARGAFGGEPDVWHIHNHSLGKNPALIQEVTHLAMAGQKIVLQIHDFSEDGRPDNYSKLWKLRKCLYPVAPQIHYATLNKRDFGFLKAAGIPKNNLHLLPNTVPFLPPTLSQTSHSTQLYVYPCRAIRRKNIGELLLWSARMPNDRFAVTLAPKNPEAKWIYETWVSFAKELGLKVEFDVGAKTPFHENIARADALITTSIAEGFGFAFLEPWLANKPLVGRNLPEITVDFAEHRLDLSNLYNRLPVPFEWLDEAHFFQTLEKQLRTSQKAYGRPWNDSILEEARTALIQKDTVDFRILDEEMQREIIRRVQKKPENLTTSLNPGSSAVEHNQDVVKTVYTPTAYGAELFSTYQTLIHAKAGRVEYADGEALLDAFLAPKRFNLLRTQLLNT